MTQGGDPARTEVLDSIMLELCGDVAHKRVLDLGCGEGRFCRMLAARGASVVGLDFVDPMVDAARERAGPRECYVRASGEILPFAPSGFDLVVAYLSLIDINDFRAAIRESARVLSHGGRLLVANLSFISASDGWARNEEGRRLYQRLDRYLEEREVLYQSDNGFRVRSWHRPLSAYMGACLSAGFILRRFLEPVPQDQSLRDDPRFEGDFRVPDFVVMLWEKPAQAGS